MSPELLGVTADLAPDWVLKAGLSLALVVGLLLVRWILVRLIRRGGSPLSDRQRWWLTYTKNVSGLLIFLSVILVWSEELGEIAISLAAFAVALVIASKELILCVAGAVWRAASPAFSVGDWVEIGPHSGEVIDETLFATVLQEIDNHDFCPTGRLFAVPNSLLLTTTVVNHSFRKRFLYLDFPIYSEPRDDAEAVRARIEESLREAARDFHDLARRYAQRIEKTAGVRLRDPEPRVRLDTTDMAKLIFRVALFCPRDRAGALRQRAMQAFLGTGVEAREPRAA